MMTDLDRAYYAKRAGEEEAASRTSDCPVARARHAELARLYRLRLAGAFPDRDPQDDGEPTVFAEEVPATPVNVAA